MSERLDVAYYYHPAPYWGIDEGGWVKSLLLFFDKVSILLPGYMYGRHHFADPVLAEPLEDRGLLEVLEPTNWIDPDMAKKLAEAKVVHLGGNVAYLVAIVHRTGQNQEPSRWYSLIP